LAWSKEGSSDLTINSPYTTIKTHKVSKDGGSKVQMQLVQLDGAAYVFHFAGVDPKSDRAKISELLLQMTKTAQVANPELEAKYKLLQDPGLYALYKDMVVSGIITAEEFWANRCDNTSLSNDQQSGLPSSFLGDIQAVSGCNSVQYQLSTEMIENIFRTYPSGT
jgi:transcription initiation factor TFIIH subunit 1